MANSTPVFPSCKVTAPCDLPNKFDLAVGVIGISIVNREDPAHYKIVKSFPISQIVGWEYDDECLALLVDVGDNDVEYDIETPSGLQIVNLLKGYSTSLLKEAKYAVASRDYVSSADGEYPSEWTCIYIFLGMLNFHKGDVITIASKGYDGWYTGKLGDNTGLFPLEYVQLHMSIPKERLHRPHSSRRSSRCVASLAIICRVLTFIGVKNPS